MCICNDRIRGATWTDEEVHKLFHVWSQPTIFNGFLNEKRKKEVFFQVSTELKKLNVTRSWEECRAKIKNLKGEYKKARDARSPRMFKFYSLMEKVLNTTSDQGKDVSLAKPVLCPNQTAESGQPMQIEFEIMPAGEIDFRGMKSELPIEISPGGSINSIIIPHSNFITSDLESVHVQNIDQVENASLLNNMISNGDKNLHTHTSVEMGHAMDSEDGTPVIVITTTETSVTGAEQATASKTALAVSHDEEHSETITPRRYPYRDSYTNAGKRQQKFSTSDVNYKRRKLHQLSEKMSETVDRVLTRTTNALIQEMKASEERFMEWEEKRRLEEQKREEKLLQSLVDALKSKSGQSNETAQVAAAEEKESQERHRIMNMIQSSDDPCAITFDLLATRLTTMLTDQQRETEQSLYQWESRMQKQEMKHTDNLFNMILTAVKSHNNQDDDSV